VAPEEKNRLGTPGKKKQKKLHSHIQSVEDVLQYRLKVGWAEMRGRRPDMQDTLSVFSNFRGSPYMSLLCCFDGHSGEKSAELAARRVLRVVTNRFEEKEKEVLGKTKKRCYLKNETAVIQVFSSAFRDIHGEITEKKLDDGTAALVAFVDHENRRLVVANAGDQRSVLARGTWFK